MLSFRPLEACISCSFKISLDLYMCTTSGNAVPSLHQVEPCAFGSSPAPAQCCLLIHLKPAYHAALRFLWILSGRQFTSSHVMLPHSYKIRKHMYHIHHDFTQLAFSPLGCSTLTCKQVMAFPEHVLCCVQCPEDLYGCVVLL